MRQHLEIPGHERAGWQDALVLGVAVDQALKQHFHLSTQTQSNSDQSVRSKLVRAYQTHIDINRKVKATFDDEQAAKVINGSINAREIIGRVVEQLIEIQSMDTDDMEVAVEEELEALGLDNWPRAAYLDS